MHCRRIPHSSVLAKYEDYDRQNQVSSQHERFDERSKTDRMFFLDCITACVLYKLNNNDVFEIKIGPTSSRSDFTDCLSHLQSHQLSFYFFIGSFQFSSVDRGVV